MPETTDLTVSCHCGAATHNFAVPTASLPLPSHLCSCDISRRISGSLLTSYIPITHRTSSVPDPPTPNLSNLTCYPSSSILNRYFCSTCGTHLFLKYHDDRAWWAATGTLTSPSTDGIVDFQVCMWIDDTKDGGVSQFIREIKGKELGRWAQEDASAASVPLDWRSTSPSLSSNRTTDPIYAHCHCRAVEFWITPPGESSKRAVSPWPDVLVPHSLDQSTNPENQPWWIAGTDGDRFLAGTCTCHSCRRASGFDITFWAFVPVGNIFRDKDLTTPFPTLPTVSWGSMKEYKSSPGVIRTFCSKCGANVFWTGESEEMGRKGLIDVAAGLLDAPSGARAEELLEWWTERVSFEEDGVNRGLVGGLQRGLVEWKERNKKVG